MNKIIIVHYFQPGSAATNRVIAYAKGFNDLGLGVVLVLGGGDATISTNISDFDVIRVSSKFHQLLMPKMARVVKQYYQKNNSAILVYGTPSLCFFLPKYKYDIFYECTEVPFYGMKKTLSGRIKESIKLWMSKRATGMLVISHALYGYFKEKGIRNIAVINMFVDAERFDIRQQDSIDKYVAYCGKISNFKDGLDCLVRAFKIFHDRYPTYYLKLIGDFRFPAFERELRALINSLELNDAVIFTGAVSPDLMPDLLCGAQMLALARPNNEQANYGFPTKLGEYLATGKPVVLTRVGEINMFLRDKINCRMAEPDNPKDFAEKMIWVAEHYEDALAIGREGKALTMTEFSSLEQSRRAYNFINNLIR